MWQNTIKLAHCRWAVERQTELTAITSWRWNIVDMSWSRRVTHTGCSLSVSLSVSVWKIIKSMAVAAASVQCSYYVERERSGVEITCAAVDEIKALVGRRRNALKWFVKSLWSCCRRAQIDVAGQMTASNTQWPLAAISNVTTMHRPTVQIDRQWHSVARPRRHDMVLARTAPSHQQTSSTTKQQ